MAAETVGALVGLGAIAVILLIFFWLVMAAVSILALIFWIFMLVDVVKRKFPQENDRIVWILVVVLAGFIGAIVYYFVVKAKDKKKSKK